ncbi:MAG: hydrogenase maturation protease [Burkholderiales bacterium]
MASPQSRHVLIGLGNVDRGDDGAGRLVARMLKGQLPANVNIVELDGEVTAVLSRLQEADVAVLVDACNCGAPAGDVLRFDVAAQCLPQHGFAVSTHGVDIANALELARTLGDLPEVCIVYGIEGQQFGPGSALSAPVAEAVREVAQRVLGDFERLRSNGTQLNA